MERPIPPYPMALKVLSPKTRVWADIRSLRAEESRGLLWGLFDPALTYASDLLYPFHQVPAASSLTQGSTFHDGDP